MADDTVPSGTSPVRLIPGDAAQHPQPGIGLCLSGGGYRAMLFHLGALWRLSEWGYLKKLARISSVSGGSITAGMLGFQWNSLSFDANGQVTDFDVKVVQPIRALASKTIDEASIIGGIFLPGSIADKVADAYRKNLFGNATLETLPLDRPRFVINATSVQTGDLFRFSRPYMADYRVGRMMNPKIELAVAVAASSAFPPVLSPLKLELDPASWAPPSGQSSEDLHEEPYLSAVVLTDGGVYDNLGLETVWKNYLTVLVSDGGANIEAEPEPKSDWARHAIRITEIIDNQVRSLRVRQVIDAYRAKRRQGAYWGIRSNMADFDAPNTLPCPVEKTTILAHTKTRLKRLESVIQERLINWGYAICDAAMRKRVDPTLSAPAGFPYPASGIG